MPMPRSPLSFLLHASLLMSCGVITHLSAQTDLDIPPVLSITLVNPTQSSGLRVVADGLEIRSAVGLDAMPLLPIIFFDRGSSAIPQRYARIDSNATSGYHERGDILNTITFDPDRIHSGDGTTDELNARRGSGFSGKYYELLNILGFRLRSHPTTTITLRGEHSGEPGEELRVADERAVAVREYLTGVWKIAPERLILLPSQRAAAPEEHFFRQQEGRRVVVSSTSWEIHRPVLYRFVELILPVFSISTTIDTKVDGTEIVGIDLIATAEGDTIATGSHPPTDTSTIRQWEFIWSIPRPYERFPHEILFRATLRLSDGRTRRSNLVSIPVIDRTEQWNDAEWARNDSLGRRYSIPFFAAGDTTLDALRRLMIDNMIPHLERRIASLDGHRSVITLLSSGEEGEYPAIDPSAMALVDDSLRADIERMRRLLRLIPSANTFSEKSQDDPGGYREFRRRVLWDLYRVDHDLYREYEEWRWAELRKHQSGSNSARQHQVFNLLTARAGSVLSELGGRLDSTIAFDVRTTGSPAIFVPGLMQSRPEYRFYCRRVAIMVSP